MKQWSLRGNIQIVCPAYKWFLMKSILVRTSLVCCYFRTIVTWLCSIKCITEQFIVRWSYSWTFRWHLCCRTVHISVLIHIHKSNYMFSSIISNLTELGMGVFTCLKYYRSTNLDLLLFSLIDCKFPIFILKACDQFGQKLIYCSYMFVTT